MKKYILILFFPIFWSCATNPYSRTNRIHKKVAKNLLERFEEYPSEKEDTSFLDYSEDWVGTTNFNLRKPNYVVLHHTAQDSVEHTLKTFTLPRTQVSAHYVIAEDGTVYHMLNDLFRAWHAGTGSWGSNSDLNSSSIGIELDNNGSEPFSEAQISSLIDLLGVLKKKYEIPTENFIGHSDMAPSRKVDPSISFPWEKLAEEGFGYWYDENLIDNASVPVEKKFPKPIGIEGSDSVRIVQPDEVEKEPAFPDPKIALKIIGYDVSDLDSAIRAFELHFIQKNVDSDLSEEDLKILYNVYPKYL